MSSSAQVVHTIAKQIITRARQVENKCEMYKGENVRGKRAKLFCIVKYANLCR